MKRNKETGKLLAIHSETTGAYYCGVELARCEKTGRRKRAEKKTS